MSEFFKNDIPDPGPAEIPRPQTDSGPGRKNETTPDQAAVAAILSYIPFLCLVPLLQMRDNEQARFHSRQGLVLFIIEIVAGIFLIPGLSAMIWKLVLVLALGAAVAGIIFGIQGKMYKIPLIGDLAEKLKI